jgi:hypothetical protein
MKRRHEMKTMLLLMATAGAVAVSYAAASSAAPGTWATEHYVTNETWHAFADVGKKDNGGPDDIYVAQQALRTADGRKVGVVNGYGINLHPPYVFFHWTAQLPGGTLTLAAAVSLKERRADYPIEGGTGRYAGVRGTVVLVDAGSRGTDVTVRYRP